MPSESITSAEEKSPQKGVKHNSLDDTQKHRLNVWLEKNREGIEKSTLTAAEIAAQADGACDFTVTAHNVTNAARVIGLKLPRARGPMNPVVEVVPLSEFQKALDRICILELNLAQLEEAFRARFPRKP